MSVERSSSMACLACKRRITMIKYAQIITIQYNPQGNAAPFVDSCLQFAKVLGRWRRLMHLAHGVAARAEEARFQQSLCLGVWTAPPFPRFPKEQLQAVAELLFPLPMAYPRCPAIKKQRLHGNGEGQRFYFSTGKPSFLGLVGLGRGVSGHSSAFPIRKAERANAWGQWLVAFCSCVSLFVCRTVCSCFFFFGGLGNMKDAKRCNKMETISTSCAFEFDTGGPVLPVGAVSMLFARSQR